MKNLDIPEQLQNISEVIVYFSAILLGCYVDKQYKLQVYKIT